MLNEDIVEETEEIRLRNHTTFENLVVKQRDNSIQEIECISMQMISSGGNFNKKYIWKCQDFNTTKQHQPPPPGTELENHQHSPPVYILEMLNYYLLF
ncbi:hypothetical protein J6590_078150 [Homalodisca vitripennis]|nr:hypothetical protein J6590_078150 [Homalodisca vitripennis]